MRQVERLAEEPDAALQLRGRHDSSVDREVPIGRLWQIFNESAWKCADPAPQFTDTFNEWHTCPAGEDGLTGARHNRLNATNPCGEYAFLDDTSCNLASINVLRFFNQETGGFDLDGYRHMIALGQLVLEASIHWGHFPTPDIARKTWLFRSTGLGIANLAALLMVLGLPYDSAGARAVAAALVGILTGRSYRVSARMAAVAGPFAKFALNREPMLRVIRNHARVAGARADETEGLTCRPLAVDHALLQAIGLPEWSDVLKHEWQAALELGERHGYRNAQVSVLAPTGTISFAMDCAATSIEPFFSHIVYKKLSGGGFMKLANPMIGLALQRLGYTDGERESILAYITREESGRLADGKIEGAPFLKEEHLAVFDTANQCGTGRRYIGYRGHVLMVAALTPLLSGAISKTVNLPREATIDDFKAVVLDSWRLGVKGITLYRDGSKIAQPLNLRLDDEDAAIDLENLAYQPLLEYARKAQNRLQTLEREAARQHLFRRDKPVGIRAGHTHPAQIDDVKIYTTVNRGDTGEISEIYITTDREGTLIMGLLNALSKTISVMLQYHIPAQNISKMLRGQKYEPYGFVTRHPYIKYCTSISDLISKVIDIELGDYSRCQVKPAAAQAGAGGVAAAAPAMPEPAGSASDTGSDTATDTGADIGTDTGTGAWTADGTGSEPDPAEAGVLAGKSGQAPAFPNLRDREYATGAQDEPRANGMLQELEQPVHEQAREAAFTWRKTARRIGLLQLLKQPDGAQRLLQGLPGLRHDDRLLLSRTARGAGGIQAGAGGNQAVAFRRAPAAFRRLSAAGDDVHGQPIPVAEALRLIPHGADVFQNVFQRRAHIGADLPGLAQIRLDSRPVDLFGSQKSRRRFA